MRKKVLSFILTFAMILGTIPTMAFAEDNVHSAGSIADAPIVDETAKDELDSDVSADEEGQPEDAETTPMSEIQAAEDSVAVTVNSSGKETSYPTVIEAFTAAMDEDAGIEEIRILKDTRELLENDFSFTIPNDLKITAAKEVTVEFYNQGTKYDLLLDGARNNNNVETLTIGKNVTVSVVDRIIWTGYTGKDIRLAVEGTLQAWQMWFGADTVVHSTGELNSTGEAFVLRRGVTVTVDGGKIDSSYFSLLSGTIEARNGAEITGGPIWFTDNLGYAGEGNVAIALDDAVWTSTGNLKMPLSGQQISLRNGASLSVSVHDGYGISEIAKGASVSIDGASFTAKELTNLGEIQVRGESTLNIEKLSKNDIELMDGAMIQNSTVGGGVYVQGEVTFFGENTFNMLYDFGTAYGEPAHQWSVDENASVTLLDKARYGLGYGDTVTINGKLSDAHAARENIDTVEKSLFMHGLVGMTNSGYADTTSTFTVNNAYVEIGSNNSFGNAANKANGDKYYGTYIYRFNNALLDASRITFYDAPSVSTVELSDSNVEIDSAFMAGDPDSTFRLINTELVVTNGSNGTDVYNQNAGILELKNSSMTIDTCEFKNTGTITMDVDSVIKATDISGNGKIAIDADGFTGTKVVIDLDSQSSALDTESVEVSNPDVQVKRLADGDVLLVNIGTVATDTLYVNSQWTSQDAIDQAVGPDSGYHHEENAFHTLQGALNKVGENQTIVILSDLAEGTVKLPVELENVTIKGLKSKSAVLKNMTIQSPDGAGYKLNGLTIEGLVFDNSVIHLTGWRTGAVAVSDLTITDCEFRDIVRTEASIAAVHINMAAKEAVNGFTFTNNVIDGVSGAENSGIYAQVTGEVELSDNVIKAVAFRPYVIQITSDDDIDDTFTVTGNTFADSSKGRAQALANTANGTDSVHLVVQNNVFTGITEAQQICYWNFNDEKTTTEFSNNYYDIDIEKNPGKIYFNKPAASVEDLLDMGIYPIYKKLEPDGTIDENSAYTPAAVAEIVDGKQYLSLADAVADLKDGDTLKLLQDVVLEESLKLNVNGSVTIDGNGKRISSAEGFKNTQVALLMLGSTASGDAEVQNHKYTIKDVVFDGIDGSAVKSVIRAQGVELTLDGCQVKDVKNIPDMLLRLDYTQATIRNCRFENNGNGMIVVHNYNAPEGTSQAQLVIDECVFINNHVELNSAVVYYVHGGGCSITRSEFVGNTIDSTVNAATLYLGFQEDCAVTGCLFQNNHVSTTKDTTRVAGAIFFGYEAEISGNAFVNNTAANANGDTLGQHICTSTYYEGTIDLSGNYFDGHQPVEGKDYLIQHKDGSGKFQLNDYYLSYTTDEAGNVVLQNHQGEGVEIPATEITLDKTSLTLYVDEQEKLTAAVTPADSTDLVIWTSDNEAVATVENGIVTAHRRGEATITATAGDVSASCQVEVIRRPSSSGGDYDDPDYAVNVDRDMENGTVTVSPKWADKGDTVTITVKPDKGYVLDELIVTDSKGNELDLREKGDNKFAFKMPGSKVTVEATFRAVEEIPEKPEVVNPFVDVNENAYYLNAVLWAVEKGITGGTTAATFSPDDACTRAQMVTFLWRAAGSPVVNYAMSFTDVPADAYYAEAVRWAVSQGITAGTSATTFSPNATVTRGQTVTFLWRAAGSPVVAGDSFADVAADAYYAPAVAWAVREGITAGIGAETFAPNANCTRGQIVTFLYRDMAK